MDIAETGNIVLFGVSMAVIIPLLVEGFKSLGMPDSWRNWVTLGLCILAAILATLLDIYPQQQGPLYYISYTVVSALVLWLIVIGLYQVAHDLGSAGRRPPTAPTAPPAPPAPTEPPAQ